MAKAQSKTIYTSFVTTPALAAAIKKAAKQQDRSASWIIGRAVELYLAQLGLLKKPSGR